MSLKAELETWAAALQAYDADDFVQALDIFSGIADSSKIVTNVGIIYATLGEHEEAVERFTEATRLDPHLAVAYFQCGVSNFLLERYELAYKDFEVALLHLRGNQSIKYEQLGLDFILYSAEVLFNRGLSLIYMGRMAEGLSDMEEANRVKATDEHNVINDALADRGEGFTVFSIPIGVLYRPAEKKIGNVKAKDYLGKARLIAASDARDTTVGFSGIERLQQGITPFNIFIDPGEAQLARSNTRATPLRNDDEAPLTRSKSTLDVVRPSGVPTRSASTGNIPPRSNTLLNAARASPNTGIGGPVRGLSVRSGGRSPPTSIKPLRSPPPPAKENDPSQLAAVYDDYLGPYNEAPAPPMLRALQPDRGVVRAQSNAIGMPATPQRGVTRSGTVSTKYAPSSFGGGSVRRRLTRRNTSRRIQYEEEEEGYASGEDLDGPFELVKIRVKLHYEDDVRGMALGPETSFEDFLEKVSAKFGKDINGIALKFKDEDGGKVSLRDDSDYDLAIETARESSKGKPEGKLVIWCTDA
ncbi:NADPH oxidase regulator NoxR [Mycena galopus ATCC 62051]|nr:NADPH oxidase regulator NoxR [Mycena galopus ATCC 62051]